MAKMRIFELAKEIGIGSKELVSFLKENHVDVASHMSSVDDAAADQARQHYSKGKTAPAAGTAAKEKPAPESTEASQEAAPVKKTAPAKEAKAKAPAKPVKEKEASDQKTAPPVKKKKLIQVFRPQNSDNANVRRTGRPSQGGQQMYRGRRGPADNRRSGGVDVDRRRPIAGRPVGPAGRRHVTEYIPPQPAPKPAPEEKAPETKPVAPQEEVIQTTPQTAPLTEEVKTEAAVAPVTEQVSEAKKPAEKEQRETTRRKPAPKPGIADQAPADPGQSNKPGSRRRNEKKKKERRDEERQEREQQRNKKGKFQKPVVQKPKKEEKPEEVIKLIQVPEKLTLRELAEKMKIQPSAIIKKYFMQGEIMTVNTELSYEKAEEIALEYEILCEHEIVVDEIEELLKEEKEDPKTMKKRPPVVCVMGHVDHGKTSILDAVRKTNVTGQEAGGITQHIGASVVKVGKETITFLDTPGHEAFTAMRMRGANSTDIAVLVVAADDGVMPQTVEAINHAKAADVEVIVAVNKIDKEEANIDRVKQELSEHELIPEDWGGSTIFVPVSAKTGEGISDLMDMILLQSEMLELKANPDRRARGLILEARLDKGKGAVANMLVQKGTLHTGDVIAAGSAHGRVRAMEDSFGRSIKSAGPSTPVSIIGLNDVPEAGEVFVCCENEREARSFSETFIAQHKVEMLDETKTRMSLDDLFNQIKEGDLKELPIVVKADVQGSVEALSQSLVKLSNDEVTVKVIHGGVGAINESDVILASASNAIIIGFNVRPDAMAKETATREGVDMRLYRVIYDAIDDIEAAMKGMLAPEFEEKVFGHAQVRQIFKASGVGTIAGCYVTDGTIERSCQARVVRDGIVVYEGEMASLKRFKDDVKEVKTGYECGIVMANFNDIKEDDQIEAFKMIEKER